MVDLWKAGRRTSTAPAHWAIETVAKGEGQGRDESDHMCKPSSLGGRAHDAALGTVVVCDCGKRWTPTHAHPKVQGRRICGCGWAGHQKGEEG